MFQLHLQSGACYLLLVAHEFRILMLKNQTSVTTNNFYNEVVIVVPSNSYRAFTVVEK